MQRLKELLAWGGVEASVLDHEFPTAEVHTDVFEFVMEGYLRGWGMTGQNVDLDIGTAIFSYNADVRNWNHDCVTQMERRFGTECEAVDIHGHDPRNHRQAKSVASDVAAKGVSKPPIGRAVPGRQFTEVLKLRTCAPHRARLMLQTNLNVPMGFANGTAPGSPSQKL